MAIHRVLLFLMLFADAESIAAPPQLFRQAAYESPVRGSPDDLLLLAGYGFTADDTVVYRAVRDTTEPLTPPQQVPTQSGPELGVAAVVSSAGIPYSLTIKLPRDMRADQSYALWVHTARGEWSRAVRINDARPLWITPDYVYASEMPAFLPRELKIVGRNLQPSTGHSTSIQFIGPQRFTASVKSDAQSSALNEHVARVPIPERLTPGRYRILVNRDGSSWVEADESLEVLPDPPASAQFSVSDPRFGGCRPDDGLDDTPCIVRALSAAASVTASTREGTVYFGPGTWDLIHGNQPGLMADEGIVVPDGVQLKGAGSALTQLHRHREWNAYAATVAFTLSSRTLVTGFSFRDLQVYEPGDHAGPYLQVGEDWQRRTSGPRDPGSDAAVTDVIITRNTFDKPEIAIGVGGIPINRLFVTYNVFGAYNSALELGGDPYDMVHKYRLDDSVIDYNVFKPGSKLAPLQKTGTMASEIGAGHRVDFSGNTADGSATDYLYGSDDAKGWRAAFFWNPNNNVEEVLVSQNTATCTGDKIGDGEAFAFDNNTNTFGFTRAPTAVRATADTITVSEPLATRQNNREVPLASYYVGHWVQIVGGPGLGQVRKITGYSTDKATRLTTIRVAPAWDVVPVPGTSRLTIGREYWQLYVVDNHVDNRQPLCQKSNRSRRVAGVIGLWGQSADSVFAGNHQYDSDGIFVQQNYAAPEHPCADCGMLSFFNFFLEISGNTVDGEYDWDNDCSSSGIVLGAAAGSWEAGPPPTVGFGVSISHNTVRHADNLNGGAIGQMASWTAGPEPHRWPLSDGLLIHHNIISNIDGPRAMPICGKRHPRIGIVFPEPAIAWRTVLYANSCKNVATPVGSGGVDTVRVCPSSGPDSCECPTAMPPR